MLSLQDNPEATAQEIWVHAALNYKTKRERERESMRLTPLGFCLRVIVYEKPLNL